MATRLSPTKRRPLDHDDEEKENNQNNTSNGGMKRSKVMVNEQTKIRNEIIQEFRKRDLDIPIQIIDKLSMNDENNRKYSQLSQFHPFIVLPALIAFFVVHIVAFKVVMDNIFAEDQFGRSCSFVILVLVLIGFLCLILIFMKYLSDMKAIYFSNNIPSIAADEYSEESSLYAIIKSYLLKFNHPHFVQVRNEIAENAKELWVINTV